MLNLDKHRASAADAALSAGAAFATTCGLGLGILGALGAVDGRRSAVHAPPANNARRCVGVCGGRRSQAMLGHIDGLGNNSNRRLTVAIATGAVIAMAGAVVLITKHESATKAVGVEGYKTLLQFLLVAVLGGGVSLVYQAFNRQAEQRAERARLAEERATVVRETRQRYLGELIGLYNSVKRTRRLLRARAQVYTASGDSHLRVAMYDEHLQLLVDAQLSLEMVVRNVRAEGTLFDAEPDLLPSLRETEEYVRDLISEYETVMPEVTQGATEIPTPPQLADFIGSYEGSAFRVRFIRPVQAAMAAIERLITAPAP